MSADDIRAFEFSERNNPAYFIFPVFLTEEESEGPGKQAQSRP
jgi:hypothetical protein